MPFRVSGFDPDERRIANGFARTFLEKDIRLLEDLHRHREDHVWILP